MNVTVPVPLRGPCLRGCFPAQAAQEKGADVSEAVVRVAGFSLSHRAAVVS